MLMIYIAHRSDHGHTRHFEMQTLWLTLWPDEPSGVLSEFRCLSITWIRYYYKT